MTDGNSQWLQRLSQRGFHWPYWWHRLQASTWEESILCNPLGTGPTCSYRLSVTSVAVVTHHGQDRIEGRAYLCWQFPSGESSCQAQQQGQELSFHIFRHKQKHREQTGNGVRLLVSNPALSDMLPPAGDWVQMRRLWETFLLQSTVPTLLVNVTERVDGRRHIAVQ